MISLISCKVDYENNTEIFWEAFHEAFPELLADEEFHFSPQQWELVQLLPGWEDENAPAHAPHPLLLIEPF